MTPPTASWHEIASANRIGHDRFKLRCAVAPGATNCRWQGVEQVLHHRPCRKDEVDAVALHLCSKFGMQLVATGTKFAHIAEHGNSSAINPLHRQFADERERSPHRGWIGVVALVDQSERPL